MKNHNEVADNVFRRRDEYEAAKRLRRKTAVRTGSVIACLCLTAAIGFGVYKSGAAKIARGLPSDMPTENSKLIILNKTDGDIGASSADIGVSAEDFTAFTAHEALEYYGANIFPKLPSDLEASDGNEILGIYRKNKGTGEIYFSTFTLRYYSHDAKRGVEIKGDKGHAPVSCTVHAFDEPLEATVINGEEVFFVDFGGGLIYAKFTHNDVFFEIDFEGLSDGEMFNVVSSLTE